MLWGLQIILPSVQHSGHRSFISHMMLWGRYSYPYFTHTQTHKALPVWDAWSKFTSVSDIHSARIHDFMSSSPYFFYLPNVVEICHRLGFLESILGINTCRRRGWGYNRIQQREVEQCSKPSNIQSTSNSGTRVAHIIPTWPGFYINLEQASDVGHPGRMWPWMRWLSTVV